MLDNERIVTFSEAAAALPKINGRHPHTSSVWRWARKGVQGVRLETRRLGGRFVTSLEALDRFSKQLAEIDLPDRSGPPLNLTKPVKSRSVARRERAVAAARAELARDGI